MALYEVADGGSSLVAIAQFTPAEGLYESEVESLIWENLDEILGSDTFRVARQPKLPHGGIPDIVALDKSGRVIVIEVKRDLDRGQLSQALEYAGWARLTNLQEISELYDQGDGPTSFWDDWTEFTDTDHPVSIVRSPHVVLAAAEFHLRTRSALDFLLENGLPIQVLNVVLYRDTANRTYLDLDASAPVATAFTPLPSDGEKVLTSRTRRVYSSSVVDLIQAGLLHEGEILTWHRPRSGAHYEVEVAKDGQLKLPDGSSALSPSAAARSVSGAGSVAGWDVWTNNKGVPLKTLRSRIPNQASADPQLTSEDSDPQDQPDT